MTSTPEFNSEKRCAVATIGVYPRLWFHVMPRKQTGSTGCAIWKGPVVL